MRADLRRIPRLAHAHPRDSRLEKDARQGEVLSESHLRTDGRETDHRFDGSRSRTDDVSLVAQSSWQIAHSVRQANSAQKLGLDLVKNQVPIKWRLNPKVEDS